MILFQFAAFAQESLTMRAHGGLPHVKRASDFGVGIARANHSVNPADPCFGEAAVRFLGQTLLMFSGIRIDMRSKNFQLPPQSFEIVQGVTEEVGKQRGNQTARFLPGGGSRATF